MELTSFNFSSQRGKLSLRFADGTGHELHGSQLMPVVAFASDLLAEVARRKRGRIHGLRVDLSRGVLSAIIGGGDGPETLEIAGPEFESHVRPNSLSLIKWAEHEFPAKAEPCW